MVKLLGSQVTSFEMDTRDSHSKALSALRNAPEGFVVMLVHGTDEYLKGGEYYDRDIAENIETERFISKGDLTAFNGKVVFCLSCDSNGLAQASLDAGAVAFIGFDDVPFNQFDASGEPIGTDVLVKHCQELIAEAVRETLERFLTGRASLDNAVDFLRLWISKKAIAYVRRYNSVKERREVAALFLRVQEGVRYYGPLGIRFESPRNL